MVSGAVSEENLGRNYEERKSAMEKREREMRISEDGEKAAPGDWTAVRVL